VYDLCSYKLLVIVRCYTVAYPYTTFVISVSQMYALYCLVHFYHGTASALKDIKPKAKFISIKMIVFFSYWQGMGLGAIQDTAMMQTFALFLGLCQSDQADTPACIASNDNGTVRLSFGHCSLLLPSTQQ
jgi:hypothetical protein